MSSCTHTPLVVERAMVVAAVPVAGWQESQEEQLGVVHWEGKAVIVEAESLVTEAETEVAMAAQKVAALQVASQEVDRLAAVVVTSAA